MIPGGRDLVPARAQGAGEPFAEHLVVVDEQQAAAAGHRASPRGSASVAVVPAPGADRIVN